MWELILNGIGLLGSGASGYSVISGFSLDKNIKQHTESIIRIENTLNDLLNRYQNFEQKNIDSGIDKIINSVKEFKGQNSVYEAQKQLINFQNEMKSFRREINSSVNATCAYRDILYSLCQQKKLMNNIE